MGRNLFNRVKSAGGKTFYFMFLLILFTAAGSFILPKIVLASVEDLIITEIMYDPSCRKEEECSDWFEIYNKASKKITLSNKEIGIIDEENLDSSCHQVKSGISIEPKEFAIIADNKDSFLKKYPDVDENIVFDSSFNLSEKGDYIRLSDSNKCKIFFVDVYYENSWGGKNNQKSLEKKNYDNKYKKDDWQESFLKNGTPGLKNSDKKDAEKYKNKVIISEVFPYPDSAKGEKEFVEIQNDSDEKIDISEWLIADSKKHEHYFVDLLKKEDLKILPKEFVYIEGNLDLNNDEDEVFLMDENGNPVVSMKYNGGKKSLSYNFSGNKWKWSRFFTKGEKNRLNNLPTSKLEIEKKVYKNMLAEFRVSAKDKDKDKLKFVWDFGDGHKSYKQNTKHKYLKKGAYQVSLKISDGSEDIFETFEIEVRNFPKKELKIVGVKANPKGKDTDLETIKIKNSSKKKINLKNWSVATGWKELYNHPINKKLIIKPGETKELTRKYAAFTLNNKQTKIELRRPDGSIASKVKYSKKEGIQDDETYEKTESGWQWTESQSDIDLTLTNINKTQTSADRTQENVQNVVENKEETSVQDDEQLGGEVLGAEIVKNNEDASNKKSVSGNFFQRIFWSTNQFINNLINLFF
jgi:hypothetical protein